MIPPQVGVGGKALSRDVFVRPPLIIRNSYGYHFLVCNVRYVYHPRDGISVAAVAAAFQELDLLFGCCANS